jgi:hypothetical protein
MSSPAFVLVGSVLLIFLVFCVVPLCVFTFLVPCCEVRFIFTSSVLYEGSCLIYVICICLRIVVAKTYCVLCFDLFVFVLCFIYSMLSVSLDCQFLIALRFSLTFIYYSLVHKTHVCTIHCLLYKVAPGVFYLL